MTISTEAAGVRTAGATPWVPRASERVSLPAWVEADLARSSDLLARFDDRYAPVPRMARWWVRRRFGRRRPYMVNMVVSRLCNLSCEACAYYDESQPEHKLAKRDPTTDELHEWIANVASLGTAVLSFLGGEPTVRSDLVELGVHARRRGLYTLLVTNGTRMDEGLCERVGQAFHRVGVSVDGDRASNDAIRGAGSYDRALAGIRTFLEARARLGFATKLHLGVTMQRGHAEGCLRLAEEGLALGVDQFLLHVNYFPHARPTHAELDGFLRELRLLAKRRPGYVAGNEAYFQRLLAYVGPEQRFRCDVDRLGHVRIGVTGEVNPCPVGVPVGGGLGAALGDRAALARAFDTARPTPHRECAHGCVRNDQVLQDTVFDPILPNPVDLVFALALR